MPEKHTYRRLVILIDLMFVAYLGLAFIHLTQKPFISRSIAHQPGLHIDGVSIKSDDDIEFLLGQYHVGDSVTVETSDDGVPRKIVLIHYFDTAGLVLDAVVVFLMFGLGAFVYFRKPHDRAALIFHLAATAVSAAIIGTKTTCTIEPRWAGSIACTIFFLAYSIGPILFVHFSYIFPYVRWKKFTWLLGVLYSISFIVTILNVLLYMQATTLHSLQIYRSLKPIGMVQNGLIVLLLVLGVTNFIIAYHNASSRVEKKKISWMLYGLSLGTAPFVLLWALPIALGGAPLIPESIFLLFLLMIPVTFSIAILKYRAMDIDVIINRSVVYVVTAGVGLGLYLAVIGATAKIITRITPETSIVISAIAAAIIALLFEPARRRTQHIVDRLFFRVQYDYRQTQSAFLEDIKKCVGIHDLATLIVERTEKILPVERLGFFRYQNQGARLALVAHRNFSLLEHHQMRFDSNKIPSDLNRPLGLSEKLEPGILYSPADETLFTRWDIALVFPMASEQKELLGFFVLGGKKSGMRFTAEDVDLLHWVTVQAGLTIERIDLQRRLLLEQAETQRLEEINRLKSYFVSSVSHDLKTPLTSIRMFAELLRTKKNISKSSANEYLEIIEGESERLTRLINNVLDFARIERGEKTYHFSEIELNGLVRHALQVMHYQFKIEKCTVHEHLCDRECIINADPDAILEALLNLISNAMKYSHDIKEISISLFRRDGHVALQVADKGIGISPEDIPHIFEPFYRAREGKTQGAGGAGLGLAIVKQVMDAHAGKVEVDSTPGNGSIFRLIFPLGLEV